MIYSTRGYKHARATFFVTTLVLAVFVLGETLASPQDKMSSNYQQKPPSTTTGAPNSGGLTVAGIPAMINAGLTEDVLVATTRKEGKALDLSPKDILKLNKACVSDAISRVMLGLSRSTISSEPDWRPEL